MKSYRTPNPGSQMLDLDELLSYATTLEQRTALKKQKERLGRDELSFK